MSSAWRPGYEPQTEEEVRELLKRITLKNGYVSDERRKILERDDPDQLVALDGLKIQISTLVERYVPLPTTYMYG